MPTLRNAELSMIHAICVSMPPNLEMGEYQEFYVHPVVGLCDFVGKKTKVSSRTLLKMATCLLIALIRLRDIQINGYHLDPKVFPEDLPKIDVKADTVISCKSDNGADVEALKISAQIRIADMA